MIDLNVRLDSSLSEEDYRYLARIQGIDMKETFPECRVFNYQTGTLKDYENIRKFALSLLQTEEAIEYAMMSLIHRLFNEGYYYLEISLTPFLHQDNKLSQRKILKAALVGLNDALEKCPGMEANIVLYCHRQASDEYNLETTKLALEYREERVVAVGLEGDDKEHPIGQYEKLFARCKKTDYPVVIELGSHYNSANSILKAAQIGAKRILSPYRLELNTETFRILLERKVYFEFHPTLDLLKKFYPSIESFPLKGFWNRGIQAYASGVSYSILDASLRKEFIHLGQHNGFSRDDVYHSLYVALQAAFLRNIRERNRVMKKVIEDFDHFYNSTI